MTGNGKGSLLLSTATYSNESQVIKTGMTERNEIVSKACKSRKKNNSQYLFESNNNSYKYFNNNLSYQQFTGFQL